LAIWLLITKSWESLGLPCVQVACHIPLEIFQQGLQICFTPHLSQSLHIKLWAPKVTRVLGQNDTWVLVLWPSTKYTLKGKVVASPKSGPWWVLWICVCSWLVHAPKRFQLCTNQLVVWFVQVHVSNWVAC